MTVIITSCSKTKRYFVPHNMSIASCKKGSLAEVSNEWVDRLKNYSGETYLASEFYGGRGFIYAKDTAQKLNAKLAVVSSGLGIIKGDTKIPPYGCTVVPGSDDSVKPMISDNSFSPQGWMRAMQYASPVSKSLTDIIKGDNGLILVSLSAGYLRMIGQDLATLPTEVKERLRILTRAPLKDIRPDLHRFVMPYDKRLDSSLSSYRGTMSDFASRALQHFASEIMPLEGENKALQTRQINQSLDRLVEKPYKPQEPALLEQSYDDELPLLNGLRDNDHSGPCL